MKLIVNDKKELNLVNPEVLKTGNVESYIVDLELDESYLGFTNTLIFKNGTKLYKKILAEEQTSFTIPHEVLEDRGDLYIGLFAEKLSEDKLEQRNSVNLVVLPVEQGSYVEDGEYTEPITPTILQEYLKQMADYFNTSKEELNTLTTELEQGLNETAQQGVSTIIDTYTEKTTELEEKIASGEYNGATFTPSVDNDGNISWSNDKGLDNPETKNISGPQGERGPVGPAGAIKTLMVEELPEIGEEGVLYFVPKTDAEEKDLYDEYMWIDGAYEFLGSKTIKIDLDDYYTKNEVDTKLDDYAKEEELTDYAKKSEIPSKTSQLENDSDYTTTAYVDSQIGNIDELLTRLDVGGGV